ncbi:oxysterol-binding protein-related protein 8-like isoform X2 [Megalops cyprinoides]|uniref:oxysterol-binding protein-related protein 8-like isoform X2 n=1 Tax=Megalops cyprinoides TaxID=118141 RepID=UPI001863B8B6|nr:oxysterol-binding protein-related protein 8-like isoform X2 [Megalops cyprinoides]XP_036373778.1 oxysterol-binding protein-related protein 8-like isoform X2 [Megalops cyprinoides]XP_036373779.1 oxysterol-binding protein-related protein 8-like isoform X2 [Megalops cyprinoides]XP_036373780.1 oxysterol-binding protein-related protein 8-like isoform X2 [Megalops cyprinoides]XP_036373781.1 oxysterol-binding protein-related protein 8-like isoform X2 [Megalops cyprinoides]XP_036373782.1 oxysterol-
MPGDDTQPLTPGRMSQRHGKEGLLAPGKDLLTSPSLSPGVSYSHGFDRGKEDLLQLKEDSTLSISKSKSETKLFNGSDKDLSAAGRLAKKESLKVQKKNYREEKKRATKELLSTITDPSVIVMADWLKIRGTLKSWTKLWCVLKPGVLLIYKTNKNGQWVGTVLLNACELIERPSKKDGFCFKLYHPLEQSIWAVKGPKGEAVGSITQPLPSSHLIFRAASESDGRCWMDALELALKCSSLLKRTMIREGKDEGGVSMEQPSHVNFYSLLRAHNMQGTEGFQFNDSDHFKDPDLYSDKSDRENEHEHDHDHDHEESDNEGPDKSEESDSDTSERQDDSYADLDSNEALRETSYLEQSHEELGEAGEASQTETVSEENKSLIWTLLKQVRPGMDLSKVVLPTFILEPRSFLDKLSDYYYHADFLSEAAVEENAYNRMKKVVKWYLSGFYKKPKGLKKPYNPIIGETFRCMWIHTKTNSKTFYISEQVSHHPPVSAFYVSNRKDGFCLSGSILAKSKFYGNSLSAILDGEARLTFLNRGEDYVMNMPYAHCKGILYGTMTLELAGQVTIACEKTGYSAQLEFKLKPFLGSDDSVNQIAGKIKLGKEVLATLEGHWDSEIFINDKKTGVVETFWNPTPELRQSRLTRCTVPPEEQGDFESEKLWQHVTRAINNKDQTEATNEKFILEEAQRKSTRERKAKCEEWMPALFEQDALSGEWHYKYADTRPWDPLNDLIQFEKDGCVQTKVRHRTPMVRSGSVISLSNQGSRRDNCKCQVTVPKRKHKQSDKPKTRGVRCSSPELDRRDSSCSERHKTKHISRLRKKGADLSELQSAIESIKQTQEEINRSIATLRTRASVSPPPSEGHALQQRDYIVIILLIFLQIVINFLFK